jgi:hypothetical protein
VSNWFRFTDSGNLLGGGDFNGGVMMYTATDSVLQTVGTCLVVGILMVVS